MLFYHHKFRLVFCIKCTHVLVVFPKQISFVAHNIVFIECTALTSYRYELVIIVMRERVNNINLH